ncbi:flavin reductase family protein [Gordonia polyisoprenivorans]|uniref:Flavin reductase family protein n=1 Tax=Gordonia polyisoprenivorans TaxID=84595 RepID=A0A846WEZ8_9ACTN|nr:flavin reductase family protein [Gordonia polyisoprenivorans]NKY00382.1 flavin reductase family protein [Gordonia polyisoprenivorans]
MTMIPTTELDATELRKAFSAFPTGVVALAGTVDGEPTVLVASSFAVGVSQDPPLVMFAVQHSSTTWPVLRKAPALGVSVLGEQQADAIRQLSSKDKAARLAGVSTRVLPTGAILLDATPVHFECTIESIHRAGDHDIVVLRIVSVGIDHTIRPIIWHMSSCTRIVA